MGTFQCAGSDRGSRHWLCPFGSVRTSCLLVGPHLRWTGHDRGLPAGWRGRGGKLQRWTWLALNDKAEEEEDPWGGWWFSLASLRKPLAGFFRPLKVSSLLSSFLSSFRSDVQRILFICQLLQRTLNTAALCAASIKGPRHQWSRGLVWTGFVSVRHFTHWGGDCPPVFVSLFVYQSNLRLAFYNWVTEYVLCYAFKLVMTNLSNQNYFCPIQCAGLAE